MSFINATLVLSIGETVEEVTDSGFLGTTPTLSCSQLGEDALLQVFYLLYKMFVTAFAFLLVNSWRMHFSLTESPVMILSVSSRVVVI